MVKSKKVARYAYIVTNDEDVPMQSFSTRERASKYIDYIAKNKGMSKREIRSYLGIIKLRHE